MDELKTYFDLSDSQMEKFKKFPERLIRKAVRNVQEAERKSYKEWSTEHRRRHFRQSIAFYLNGKIK